MLRRWVNTVIPSNCRMVKMYNTRCEGTTAASENCHITHFSTQSFQFSVLILPQFRAKTTILHHLYQLFRQKIRLTCVSRFLAPGSFQVGVECRWRWCVFTIGGKGGHWLLTSPYTELVRHHLPPARNCDRPLLTGRNKTHTNTDHQKIVFFDTLKKIQSSELLTNNYLWDH